LIRYRPEEAEFFRERLLERAKADVANCYQCGNCSASCPAAFTFDYKPNQVMRLLQVGLVDEVLSSTALQNCIQCMTCSARCPRDIDVAGVFEDLKTVAVAKKVDVPEDAATFNRLFLENIAKYGRLSEATFLVKFNLWVKRPLNDSSLGLPMVQKGKLEYIPRKAAGAGEVGRIYKKAMERVTWQA
jgi:heterodisulfide reductase subunit C2